MTRIALCTVLTILCGEPALAQGTDFGKFEAFAGGGFSRLSEGQGLLGRGPGATAGLAVFVRPHLSVGVDLNTSEHSGILPLSNMVRRSDGSTTFVSLNTAYHFGTEAFLGHRLAPYVIAGAGSMSTSRTDSLEQTIVIPHQFGSTEYRQVVLSVQNIGKREVAINAGAGVDVGAIWKFWLRPELRYFRTSSETSIRGSASVLFRW